jgi:hypothetical protein
MTSLQLGLIVAGVALVVGVIVYNWLQERRVRRRIEEAFGKPARKSPGAAAPDAEQRIEPTLAATQGLAGMPENVARDLNAGDPEGGYEPRLKSGSDRVGCDGTMVATFHRRCRCSRR